MKRAEYAGQVRYDNQVDGAGFLVREGGPNTPYNQHSMGRHHGKRLMEGDWVSFDVGYEIDGPLAHNIHRLQTTESGEMIWLFPLDVMTLAANLDPSQCPETKHGPLRSYNAVVGQTPHIVRLVQHPVAARRVALA